MGLKAGIYDIEGFKMYLDPSKKGICGSLIRRGYREPLFMWVLRNESNVDLAVDLGSNIGYATVSLCKFAKRVIAIEPDERCSQLMVKTLEANGFTDKVDFYNFAISDFNGSHDMYFAEKYNNLNTLCEVSGVETEEHKFFKKQVETRTLDSLNIQPNFIKMDIEGYEVEAINGGMESLKNSKLCKLLIEVHPQYYSEERSFAKVLTNLLNIGFHFKYVISAAVERPDLFKEKGYKPFNVMKDEKYSRGIYDNISDNDAIFFSAYTHEQKVPGVKKISQKIVRSIFLVKE